MGRTLRGLFILQLHNSLTKPKNSSWYVYILRCADKSLYTGVTNDFVRRLAEHNLDSKKAAKYTRARRPVFMVYLERVPDRSTACRREASIKRLKPKHKEAIIDAFEQDSQGSGTALHAALKSLA